MSLSGFDILTHKRWERGRWGMHYPAQSLLMLNKLQWMTGLRWTNRNPAGGSNLPREKCHSIDLELRGIHFLFINLGVLHQEVSVREAKGSWQAPLSHSYLRVARFGTWLFPERRRGDRSSPPNVFKGTISSRKSLLQDLKLNLDSYSKSRGVNWFCV